jgi:hypothetical protein
MPARANVPARGVAQDATAAAAPWLSRDRFAPEMIAPTAIMPRTYLRRGLRMTAYLISVALAGLLAIVIWEGLS